MNILVCVKRVPATGGRIQLTADGQDIDTRYLGFTVSPHEECAVEEAVRIVEAQGGSSTVLTLGPELASDQLRDAMAIGIEKGYRAHGNELELDFDLVDAGMARPSVKERDFIGREAYLEQRSRPPVAILSTLTVDDPASSSGVKRYMLGREPILTPDGKPLIDAKGRRSYVTSAGSGPSVGRHLLMSYLPPDYAKEETKLAVEYFGERYPVTVAVAGSTPLFDPENARIRS